MKLKEKIAILTDTGSFISPSQGEQMGVFVLPLQIIEVSNDQVISYDDLVDIKTHDIYEKLYEGIELKTSLPKCSDIYDILEYIQEMGYDSVIAIHLTSGISSTFATIQNVANDINMPISMIDTYTTCQIQNYVVHEVVDLVKMGYGRETIVEMVNQQISKSNSVILAKDINHLKRGGRLTPAAAVLANMLKIYPVLVMNKSTLGRIDVFEKVRTENRARKLLVDETIKKIETGKYDIHIIHSDDMDTANHLQEELCSLGMMKEDIHIADFSSVISVHVGMKCLAIQVIEKLEY